VIAFLPIAFTLLVVWIYIFSTRSRFPDESFFEAYDTKRSPDRWPSLSIVIPARNEAEVLRFTLPTILSFYYPYLEIVLVDDCSEDATAAVAEDIGAAAGAVPLRVVRGVPPPPGWQGKLWALEQGVRASTGEWLLFVDADIRFLPNLARDLVRLALDQKYHVASLMVLLRTESFWDRLLIPSFFFFFHLLYPFHWVRNVRSKTAAAAGGCLLVERASLERPGGLEAIRGAWIDDVALAGLLKRSGARLYLGATVQAASFRRYGTLQSIRHMIARSAFTQLRYSWALLGVTLLGLGFVFVLPLLASLLVTTGIIFINDLLLEYLLSFAVGCTLGLMILAYTPALRLYRLPVVWGLTLPAAALLYALMTLESALLHVWRGGPRWKGRRA
jgi:hopene-associated glycosyltransferase HpnB